MNLPDRAGKIYGHAAPIGRSPHDPGALLGRNAFAAARMLSEGRQPGNRFADLAHRIA
jgi:hypothetical protein